MSDDIRILFVDDAPADVMFEQSELSRQGIAFAARIAANELELLDALAEFEPDVVLCDGAMPSFPGARALDTVRRLRPLTPILMVSATLSDDTAVECLNWGAHSCILKSNLRLLAPSVRRAVAGSRHVPLSGMRSGAMRAIERARGRNAPAALAVLDLDAFHRVNELFGRRSGDNALRDIGAMLSAQAGPFGFAARVGGDEFLVVLPEIADAMAAGATVQRLMEAISQPRLLCGRETRLGASAGLALYPDDGTDFEGLLHAARDAMHRAKARAPGAIQFHSGDLSHHARARRRLEMDLREALQRNELTLAFQPQYDIASGMACGVEALARWSSPRGAPVAPSVFIPLAEQTGLIDALGTWALRSGCRTSAEWMRQRHLPARLSVNVSAHQIRGGFTAEITAALDRSGLPPEQLELDITESILVTNPELALRCLTQWKRLGVRIALDDFGTGHAGPAQVARLPVDRVKIDGSLIGGMTTRPQDAAMVRALIALGRERGFAVLAEGVETEAQLHMLRELGCPQAQGNLLTPPTSADAACALLGRRWGARAAPPDAPRVWQ